MLRITEPAASALPLTKATVFRQTLRITRRTVPACGTVQRSGFTLLELLITLSVMAAVAAMALPAMRGPLDKSRLRGAAREVQDALAKSRAMAIRAGREVEFLYEAGGGRYRIQRVDAVDQSFMNVMVMDDSDGAGSVSTTDNREAGFPGRVLLREGVLPTGVRFGNPESPEAGSFEPRSAQQAEPHWSTAIRFLPSGRTQQTSLRLVGDREFIVDVELRGLTGTASYSAPFRMERLNPVDSGVLQ